MVILTPRPRTAKSPYGTSLLVGISMNLRTAWRRRRAEPKEDQSAATKILTPLLLTAEVRKRIKARERKGAAMVLTVSLCIARRPRAKARRRGEAARLEKAILLGTCLPSTTLTVPRRMTTVLPVVKATRSPSQLQEGSHSREVILWETLYQKTVFDMLSILVASSHHLMQTPPIRKRVLTSRHQQVQAPPSRKGRAKRRGERTAFNVVVRTVIFSTEMWTIRWGKG
mmetsp:Transcript_104292/g.156170  ORF Transcript_104292/g.156170 Transcript_104292/m.156170 type:complete len:227 (+) Transcript_104292:82-762(+)